MLSSKRPMGGQPKSKASSWSSAEVGRLWEEPTEAISGKRTEMAVGILAACGEEDVKDWCANASGANTCFQGLNIITIQVLLPEEVRCH